MYAAKSKGTHIDCLLTPINSVRNSDDIQAGDELTLYEQQRRRPASDTWDRIGLKDAFVKKFPDESKYWVSDKSFVELYMELSAKTGQ